MSLDSSFVEAKYSFILHTQYQGVDELALGHQHLWCWPYSSAIFRLQHERCKMNCCSLKYDIMSYLPYWYNSKWPAYLIYPLSIMLVLCCVLHIYFYILWKSGQDTIQAQYPATGDLCNIECPPETSSNLRSFDAEFWILRPKKMCFIVSLFISFLYVCLFLYLFVCLFCCSAFLLAAKLIKNHSVHQWTYWETVNIIIANVNHWEEYLVQIIQLWDDVSIH